MVYSNDDSQEQDGEANQRIDNDDYDDNDNEKEITGPWN